MTALETLATRLSGDLALTPATRANVQRHLTDTVGGWVAGAATQEGRMLLGLRLGGELDLGVPSALARLSEIDNIHLPSSTTPGGIIIPAALTLGAAQSSDGPALESAMVAGIEAMIRLGVAIDGPRVIYRGIWPTYFGAPFGIAAMASRLLGLNAEQTTHALALALTFAAPGVGHHNAATTSRWFAVAQAVRNGLRAAQAAQSGFTSDTKLLDGEFLHGTFGITPNLDVLLSDPAAYGIDRASFKPWCAARQTMTATQGVKEILAAGVAASQIDAIEVRVPPPYFKMVNHGVVAGDRASHLTSLPYHLAIAAAEPEAEYDIAQSPASLSAPVQALMAKISVVADEALLTHYPAAWPAQVTVRTPQGVHERLMLNVPGDPASPLSEAALADKFRRFVGKAAGPAAADTLFTACAEAFRKPAGASALVAQIERTIGAL